MISSGGTSLSGDRLELLRQRLREKGIEPPGEESAPLPQIVPNPEHCFDPFPLTAIQQAYWMGRLGIFELGSVASHMYVELEKLDLDVERLECAARRLVDRHGMLRAVVLRDGTQQVLQEVPPYRIEVWDLRSASAADVEQKLSAIRSELSHRVVDPQRWPLFQMHASRLPGGRVRLHLSMDALMVDAGSLQILAAEFVSLYRDPDTPLEPLNVSYRDFVLAAEMLQNSSQYRRSKEYWSKRVETLAPAPELPLAQSPSAIEEHRFERRTGSLDPPRWQKLRKRISQAGLTPSGTLLAVFAEVLERWSASPRFTVNLTLFNRLPLHPQIDRVVGDFTSLTLLEVDGTREDSFEARARRIQMQLWDDLDHRYVSGVEVIRECARRHKGAPGALMPVVFTSTLTQGDEAGSFVSADALGEIVYNITQTPQVWLDHQVYQQDGALVYNWDVVEGLFAAGVIEEMFAAYRELLERLADDPESWDVPTRELFAGWGREPNESVPELSELTLDALVEAGGSALADMPAVISPTQTLSHRELRERSWGLADELIRGGVGRGERVAVVMDKGWEQIVAVLGTLRSGAAYVPIDAGLPIERLRRLLESCRVSHVVTQSEVFGRIGWPDGIRCVVVDANSPATSSAPPRVEERDPGDLAYVIYTSGSTGEPKGVMIDHRGAVNTVLDVNRRFEVGSTDRVLALSNLSFDLSVYDVFGLLAAGGAVVVPAAEGLRDPAHWASLILQHEVSVWNTVPALMEMLVAWLEGRSDSAGAMPQLALLSGDWIPVDLPDRIRALRSDARIIGLGGATEASIWSIFFPIAEVPSTWTSIPYGKPLSRQDVMVLDHRLDTRPDWVTGALYIAGDGLAVGYWADPEQTSASFVRHPITGGRLYRTGDLGRYLPDGDVELLGREDSQVKIRGHRIELGEIETILAQHREVQAAAVVADGDRHNRRLVAFVVAREVETADAEQIEAVDEDPLERLRIKLERSGLRDDVELERIALPGLEDRESVVADHVRRRSHRRFLPEAVPLERLGQLLAHLSEFALEGVPFPKRRYGSAGGVYPVQAYLWVRPGGVEGLDPGVYYYHPGEHRLLRVSPDVEIPLTVYDVPNRPILSSAALGIFLIGHLDAITRLYGERGGHYALLEAGAMTQLLEQAAPDLEIGFCQIGRLEFDTIRSAFGLAPGDELLHSLLGGPIDPHQNTLEGLVEDSADGLKVLELMEQHIEDGELPDAGQHAAYGGGRIRERLENHLLSRLPEYMVPADIVVLDALPLSASGKVDRRALLQSGPAARSGSAGPMRTAPRNELESVIAGELCAVLGIEEIGMEESLFDLGGDSVQMVELTRRLEDRLGFELSVVDLFRYTTVESLAEFLEDL